MRTSGCLVGEAGVDKPADEVDDLWDVFGDAGLYVGRHDVQGLHVLKELVLERPGQVAVVHASLNYIQCSKIRI